MRTRTETVRLIRIALISIGVLIIASYAIWRSLNYARGPEITIFEPVNGSTIPSSTVILNGKAERINNITLNGDAISIDQEGNFRETVVIFPGINKITIEASDQFERNTKTELTLFGASEFPNKRIIGNLELISD